MGKIPIPKHPITNRKQAIWHKQLGIMTKSQKIKRFKSSNTLKYMNQTFGIRTNLNMQRKP